MSGKLTLVSLVSLDSFCRLRFDSKANIHKQTFRVGADRLVGGASSVTVDIVVLEVHPPLVQASRTS